MKYDEWLAETRGRKDGETIVAHCIQRAKERYGIILSPLELWALEYKLRWEGKESPDGVYEVEDRSGSVLKASVSGGRIRTFLP